MAYHTNHEWAFKTRNCQLSLLTVLLYIVLCEVILSYMHFHIFVSLFSVTALFVSVAGQMKPFDCPYAHCELMNSCPIFADTSCTPHLKMLLLIAQHVFRK
uniref:Putative secreted protein n=1 Tax=Amblyomma tuberculatum TaxID=48802 RepID=A0A6M2E421_9ACAR